MYEEPTVDADADADIFALAQAEDVAALLRLMRDPDAEVRDLATFGLGFLMDHDTPQIRQALWERLSDEDQETREEAVRGLAMRGDGRVTEQLADLLRAESSHVHTFAAAAALADPVLLPLLRNYDPEDPGVTEALLACDPRQAAGLVAGDPRTVELSEHGEPDELAKHDDHHDRAGHDQ
ncbi:HEAT repeat domain-containing protein [Streptomyces fildesensis]|uniref:HEAT repeat domain-containing protein n=1 Tax=Streptomyces fildesensis TaxID=375757 RepID=A0ABW8C092_9ACTN